MAKEASLSDQFDAPWKVAVEIQAQPTAQFPWRMWVYYYRLCDKYGPAVISLAILADADPRWRPHTYETEIAGCGLRFEFPVFKVLDCEDAETRFEQTGNPFALVLAAQQLALATQRDPRARYEGRLRLARQMRRRGLVEADLKSGVLVSCGGEWKDMVQETVMLAGQHTDKLGCRSLDILHCAAAKLLGVAEFVSTDARQKRGGRKPC